MTDPSPDYVPVPTIAAREVAERYAKDAVVVVAIDGRHGRTHVTTYGTTAAAKDFAAALGEALGRVVSDAPAGQRFEDFREPTAAARATRAAEAADAAVRDLAAEVLRVLALQQAYFAARRRGAAAAEELEASKAAERAIKARCERLAARPAAGLFDAAEGGAE